MDKTFWVIEAVGNQYWTGRGMTEFSTDIDAACQFSREHDAEKIRCYFFNNSYRNLLKSVEHMYVDKIIAENTEKEGG